MIHYVTPDEVIALHDFLLEHYAGLSGIPDSGRARAIVERVINRAHYEGLSDIYELAATYWVAIARGHIFTDGNKRTALNVTMLFLKRNSVAVYDRPELVELTVQAATGALLPKQLAENLKEFYSR